MTHDHNIHDQIQFYLPINELGTSVKLDWAEDHVNLVDENYKNNDVLFVYTDSSLSYDKGTCKTGYRVTVFRSGREISRVKEALSKYTEVYNAEMKGHEVASRLIHDLFNS